MTHESTPLASLLVVDDTLENLRLLGDMLGEEGYEVRPVSSGRQALQAIEHDPPDLVLLDVNMPDMDGYEVCRRLRAQDGLRDVPVIFLTAWTDRAYMVKAFEVGGADYVTKPFLFEEVLARVQTHIALKRARTALAGRDEQLRQFEQLRRDLLHTITHDIEPPLMTMASTASYLKTHHAGAWSDEARTAADAVIEAAANIQRIARELLEATDPLDHANPAIEPQV